MKYRNALIDVIGGIVRERKRPTEDQMRVHTEPAIYMVHITQ
jgi:hypothetical protein